MTKRIVTRTIYGAHLQKHLALNIPFEAPEHSTLNEKFDIGVDETRDPENTPVIQYYTIGDKGHRMRTAADGVSYTSPVNHRASDAALFRHIPFILRREGEDISPDRRAHYGLRRVEVINGERYIAYYLKRIDTSTTTSDLLFSKVVEGVETSVDFVPTIDNLNPQPPEIPNSGVISTDGHYLSTSSILTIDFNEWDVDELINVARVLYDNEERAIISEIGLCSGVDHVMGVDTPTGSFNYNDAIDVQVAIFITGYYPVGFTNKGFTFQVDAGATEPLLSYEPGE